MIGVCIFVKELSPTINLYLRSGLSTDDHGHAFFFRSTLQGFLQIGNCDVQIFLTNPLNFTFISIRVSLAYSTGSYTVYSLLSRTSPHLERPVYFPFPLRLLLNLELSSLERMVWTLENF